MDDAVRGLLSLDGKVAMVTGAATGIGEGIARLLAAAGANVAILDVDEAGAESVAAAIRAAGGRCVARRTDVTSLPEVTAAAEALARELGSIDILVNNAGLYRGAGSIHDISAESWRAIIAVNLDSVFNCSKAASAQMVRRGAGGAIVNIASVDGILPFIGVNYDAAKAGVIQFTRALALDLSPHGIRVNAVAPGFVPVRTLARVQAGELPPIFPTPSEKTGLQGPMASARSANIPMRRPGTPEDIARAVLFFCTEASAYVTGQTLAVDGGWLLV